MPVASHLTFCGCSLTGDLSGYLRLSEINMQIHENCPSKMSLAIINLKANNNNNNNNNNNVYLLQLCCYPVAVVILHVNKT